MMKFYIFDNYLKNENLFMDKSFTNKLIGLLDKKIKEDLIESAFYTHYSLSTPHIKIGMCANNNSGTDAIKREISELIGNNLQKQSDTRPNLIYFPADVNDATDIIACYSFKLLGIVRSKENSEISKIYFRIFSHLINDLKIAQTDVLINFGAFKVRYPNYFLSRFKITKLNLSEDSQDISGFCDELSTWLKNNIANYNEIWFICDRLFHHCNNSNNKFGEEEMAILADFIQYLNSS